EPAALLRHLETRAVMLRGNWALASELCHPSPHGVGLRDARDVVLAVLQRYGAVTRADVTPARLGVSPEQLEAILSEAAAFDPAGQRWVLRLPDDLEGAVRFPEVFAASERWWRARVAALMRLYHQGHGTSATAAAKAR
ncbi:unnamed protein product, partial [Phaeothamnion confervicola]